MSETQSGIKSLMPVFISHATRNFRIADDVRVRLEALDIPCWIAPRDIPSGSAYGEEISGAIQKCAAVILILTEEANLSRAVANELEMAFRHQRVIIPVRFKPVAPSNSLAFYVNNTQWVDVCQTPLKQRLQEIVRIIEAVRSGSPPPQPVPELITFLSSLERRVEGLIRYKFLTLAVTSAILFFVASIGVIASGKMSLHLQTEQKLINEDPSTYGLVSLTADLRGDQEENKTPLRAVLYLNLRNPILTKASWHAFAQSSEGVKQVIDTSGLGELQASEAKVLTLMASKEITTVVFCLNALHPNLGTLHMGCCRNRGHRPKRITLPRTLQD